MFLNKSQAFINCHTKIVFWAKISFNSTLLMKITSHFAVRENGDDCWCQLWRKKIPVTTAAKQQQQQNQNNFFEERRRKKSANIAACREVKGKTRKISFANKHREIKKLLELNTNSSQFREKIVSYKLEGITHSIKRLQRELLGGIQRGIIESSPHRKRILVIMSFFDKERLWQKSKRLYVWNLPLWH